MPTVTVRDLPDEVRDELAARAARQGKSLQEYLYDELSRLANRPSVADLMADVGRRKRLNGRHVTRESILDAARRRPPVIQVVDASVVVAALIDDSPVGRWCEDVLRDGHLAAPHLMPFEVANIVWRLVLRDEIDETTGALAIDDLGRLAVDLAPYEAVATRVWELRANLTSYDAAYIATAELLGGRLTTLDTKLARAPGPRCEIATPP